MPYHTNLFIQLLHPLLLHSHGCMMCKDKLPVYFKAVWKNKHPFTLALKPGTA